MTCKRNTRENLSNHLWSLKIVVRKQSIFVFVPLSFIVFHCVSSDITSLMAGLSGEQKENECISFSLKLRAAWSLGNYHRFFKLYRIAPKMAGYLVDWFADRERRQALRAMLKGFVFHGNLFEILLIMLSLLIFLLASKLTSLHSLIHWKSTFISIAKVLCSWYEI